MRAVCVVAACVIESNLSQSTFTAKELSPFGTGFVSLTLSLNIIVTSKIQSDPASVLIVLL